MQYDAEKRYKNDSSTTFTTSWPDFPSVETFQELEWDFTLPEIPSPLISPRHQLIPGGPDGTEDFNLRDLIGAVQSGMEIRFVTEYFAYYDRDLVRRHIRGDVEGVPSIFFAVATNKEAMIRTWVTNGADANAVHAASGVPLLAFAIIHSEILDTDTTFMVSILLSLGARPEVIPSAFFTPYTHDLPMDGPSDENLKDDLEDETKSWCTPLARTALARTANLTHRYNLDRASKAKRPSIRHTQVAKSRKAEPLLGIPYFLIGQAMASNRIYQKLLSHMVLATTRPLVMVLAGPSGHGKTELARALGHLMTLDLEIVDCTIYNREDELFGPRKPYHEYDAGSPLNNFLARNAGERCIVFLDEFEKTSKKIHQALLVPFDNGKIFEVRSRTILLM